MSFLSLNTFAFNLCKNNWSFLQKIFQREMSVCVSTGPVLYDLYAICNHAGTVNMGHYTACCLDQSGWCFYNDSRWDLRGSNTWLPEAVLCPNVFCISVVFLLRVSLLLPPCAAQTRSPRTSFRQIKPTSCSTNAAAARPPSGNSLEDAADQSPRLQCP